MSSPINNNRNKHYHSFSSSLHLFSVTTFAHCFILLRAPSAITFNFGFILPRDCNKHNDDKKLEMIKLVKKTSPGHFRYFNPK